MAEHKVTVEHHIMGPEDRERFPEHAKKDDATTPAPVNTVIGAFLDWLESQGVKLCTNEPVRWMEPTLDGMREVVSKTNKEWLPAKPPIGYGPEGWIAAYLELDPKKLAAEQAAMLEDFQAAQKAAMARVVERDLQPVDADCEACADFKTFTLTRTAAGPVAWLDNKGHALPSRWAFLRTAFDAYQIITKPMQGHERARFWRIVHTVALGNHPGYHSYALEDVEHAHELWKGPATAATGPAKGVFGDCCRNCSGDLHLTLGGSLEEGLCPACLYNQAHPDAKLMNLEELDEALDAADAMPREEGAAAIEALIGRAVDWNGQVTHLQRHPTTMGLVLAVTLYCDRDCGATTQVWVRSGLHNGAWPYVVGDQGEYLACLRDQGWRCESCHAKTPAKKDDHDDE